ALRLGAARLRPRARDLPAPRGRAPPAAARTVVVDGAHSARLPRPGDRASGAGSARGRIAHAPGGRAGPVGARAARVLRLAARVLRPRAGLRPARARATFARARAAPGGPRDRPGLAVGVPARDGGVPLTRGLAWSARRVRTHGRARAGDGPRAP